VSREEWKRRPHAEVEGHHYAAPQKREERFAYFESINFSGSLTVPDPYGEREARGEEFEEAVDKAHEAEAAERFARSQREREAGLEEEERRRKRKAQLDRETEQAKAQRQQRADEEADLHNFQLWREQQAEAEERRKQEPEPKRTGKPLNKAQKEAVREAYEPPGAKEEREKEKAEKRKLQMRETSKGVYKEQQWAKGKEVRTAKTKEEKREAKNAARAAKYAAEQLAKGKKVRTEKMTEEEKKQQRRVQRHGPLNAALDGGGGQL